MDNVTPTFLIVGMAVKLHRIVLLKDLHIENPSRNLVHINMHKEILEVYYTNPRGRGRKYQTLKTSSNLNNISSNSKVKEK